MSAPDPLLSDPRVIAIARARLDAARARWRTDPRAFRMECRALDRGLRYGDCFEPWQEDHFFGPVDAGLSLWSETPRGHDRTDAEGWSICAALQHGPPDQRIVIAAADKDQARFPLERAERYTQEDRDLFPGVTVQKNEVLGPRRSRAVVISSDVASSLGEKPTEVWAEELGVWPERGARLWNSIVGSCTKLGAPIRVLTNAGAGKVGNWRWTVREWFRAMAAEHPDRYHFWSAPGWVAAWSRGRQRELEGAYTSEHERQRFLHNRWLDSDEHAAFDSVDRERVFAADYEEVGTEIQVPGEAPRPIVAVVQAGDYGLTDDALCCGSVGLTADADCWLLAPDLAIAGRPGREASIREAQDFLLEGARRRRLEATVIDRHQAAETVQRIGAAIRAGEGVQWSLPYKRAMYAVLLSKLRAGKFHARRTAFRRTHAGGLVYDLEREMAEAVEKAGDSGSYLTHPEGGHDDGLSVGRMAVQRRAECPLEAAVAVEPTPAGPSAEGWRAWRETTRPRGGTLPRERDARARTRR